ncbi:hypothetical protein GCM10027174_14530 [Salinifilum aidingensis]
MAAPAHPLDPLTPAEIRHTREILVAAGLVTETTRFPQAQLVEPPKSTVLVFTAGDAFDRRVRCVLLDIGTGEIAETDVSLSRQVVVRQETVDPVSHGQPPIMGEEFAAVDEIVKADPDWREAVARRGIRDLDRVCVCPLSAGAFGIEGERGGADAARAVVWQAHEADSPWAHPIDGVVAYVDVTEHRVLRVNDDSVRPVRRCRHAPVRARRRRQTPPPAPRVRDLPNPDAESSVRSRACRRSGR